MDFAGHDNVSKVLQRPTLSLAGCHVGLELDFH